jgi:hypothetical protein
MSIEFKNIWTSSNVRNSELPDLTHEMVYQAETLLGVKLPQLFIDLLKVKNGGYVRNLIFSTEEYHSYLPNKYSLLGDYLHFNCINGIPLIEENVWSFYENCLMDEHLYNNPNIDPDKHLALYGFETSSITAPDNIMQRNELTYVFNLPKKQVIVSSDSTFQNKMSFITLDYRESEIPRVLWTNGEDEVVLALTFEDFIYNSTFEFLEDESVKRERYAEQYYNDKYYDDDDDECNDDDDDEYNDDDDEYNDDEYYIDDDGYIH